MKVFLHGGGDHPDWREAALGPFLKALRGQGPLALVSAAASRQEAEENAVDYRAILESMSSPSGSIRLLAVTLESPLTRAMLEEAAPSGIFVCGGATPVYHQALAVEKDWVRYLEETGIPYCGTSAGAAVAAGEAILGGWQVASMGETRPVLFQGAGEGLDLLTVRPGLGLVPFSVDVHASQMGTLSRVIHAVENRLIPGGWGIDENTMLEAGDDPEMRIHGRGFVYHVWRDQNRGVQVDTFTAPARIQLSV